MGREGEREREERKGKRESNKTYNYERKVIKPNISQFLKVQIAQVGYTRGHSSVGARETERGRERGKRRKI